MKKLLLIIPLVFLAFFTNAQNYYTRQAGNWNDNTTVWSIESQTGGVCACTPGAAISGSTVVTIGNSITSSNALSSLSGSGSLIIGANDSATIRISVLDISNNATITVNGILVLYGDLKMSGTTALTVSGTGHVVIFGNVSNSGSATVTNNGYFLVSGTVAKAGSAVFNGANQSFETGGVTGTMNVIH